jgi:hypothetical protein
MIYKGQEEFFCWKELLLLNIIEEFHASNVY